ncbi:MAG TPA: DUF6491 family protein, partial [Arenimonas sp.]|uniref:DUF6491 family protein n=1 Tax=Arenimonas sp. TaxID=1872635 RepID=UPI002D1B7CC2
SAPADTTATPTTSAKPLRGQECLNPVMARSFVFVDDQHVLVDAGQRKYRIEVSRSCTALSYTNQLAFRGDPATNQVCGSIGDAIITRDYPCKINRIELLSSAEHKQAVQDAEAERKSNRRMVK